MERETTIKIGGGVLGGYVKLPGTFEGDSGEDS